MTQYEYIEYEENNNAATIRLDRPDKLNAMNPPLREELINAIQQAGTSNDVRAVILTGNGKAFSSGYDFESSEERSLDEYMLEFDHDHYNTIFRTDLPVIAAVNGYALAGATNLAISCDITIASENAEFGYPEMHMGGLPDRLFHPYIGCSIKHAKELFFTGKHVSADEAERIGLVNKTVPHDKLMDEVWEIVEGIKLTPPSTVALAKTMLNDAMESHGFRSDGKLDDALWALSWKSDASQKFRRIRDEEGLEEAMEWMHNTPKY